LLFVVFDDLRLRREIRFGNAAHACGCRLHVRERHTAGVNGQVPHAAIAAAVGELPNIQSLNDTAFELRQR
jgi:hypothetical protein